MADLNQFLARTAASGQIPGLSLATLRSGARGPESHFGLRGAHDQSGVDGHTVFEAASLTKPLVAFIALQLIEEGLLDLHRPLFDICGDYVPGDLRSRQITPFHVLTHTSGLPNIVRAGTPLWSYFHPGERFSYGSSAFGCVWFANSARGLRIQFYRHCSSRTSLRSVAPNWARVR